MAPIVESYIDAAKIRAFWSAVSKARTVALFSHVNPDGDACGSALALSAVLRKLGKQTYLYCPSEVGGKLTFLDGYEDYAAEKPSSCDIGIAVDCADEGRMGECAFAFGRCRYKIVVDHHKTSSNNADLSIVRPKACASAELIFMLIDGEKRDLIDKTVAKLLFCALVTDSGGFSFSSVTPTTYAIGARLLSSGIEAHRIFEHFLKSTTPAVFRLRNRVLSRAEFFEEGKIGVVTFFADDFAATGTTERDTEGIVNAVRDVDGVKIAIAMTETGDGRQFKVSLRTDDTVDAAYIASVFDGGGHFNAAGCRIGGYYEDVKDRLLKACRDWL